MEQEEINNKSIRRRLLLFMNLDIVDQIMVLGKIFIPLLLLGGLIQYLQPEGAGKCDLLGLIIGIFVLIVLFLSIPEQKVEIGSAKTKYRRLLMIIINLCLGVFYSFVSMFLCAKIAGLIVKNVKISEDALFVYWFCTGLIFVILFIWLVIFKYQQKLFFKLPYGEIKGVHSLNIDAKEFLQVANKQKHFVFGLADIKRKRMKVGDILVFKNIDSENEFINKEIKALYAANNFQELLLKMPKNEELKSNLFCLNQQYPLQRQQKRKVVAIQF